MSTPQVSLDSMTKEQLLARIAELESQKAAKGKLWLKISEKGGVSLYGLNVRFPVTLYYEQWLRLLEYADTIKEFLTTNRNAGKLKTKAEAKDEE